MSLEKLQKLPTQNQPNAAGVLMQTVFVLLGIAYASSVGGLGSLVGAFVAAMVLGMVQALGAVYLPDLSAVLPFVIMVAVLIWKPAGFAGSRT